MQELITKTVPTGVSVVTVRAGDHTLFIGSVIDSAELKDGANPLIFRWNDFFGKK